MSLNISDIRRALLNSRGLDVLDIDDNARGDALIVYRKEAVDWSQFHLFTVDGIKKGSRFYLEETYDPPRRRQYRPGRILAYQSLEYRSGVKYRLQKKRAAEYNFKLLQALRGVILTNSMQLSIDLTGHFRTPFDENSQPESDYLNYSKIVENVCGVNKENWLEIEFLSKMDETLTEITYHSLQASKTDYGKVVEWMRTRIEIFSTEQKLDDPEFWIRGRAEAWTYIELLQKRAKLWKILAEFAIDSSDTLFRNLRSAATDFALLAESVFKRLVHINYRIKIILEFL